MSSTPSIMPPTSTFIQTPTPKLFPTLEPSEQAWKDLLEVTHQAEQTSESATQQVNIALATQFPQTCYSSYPSLSPDGHWLAVTCEAEQQIRIANRDGSQIWKVDYQSLFTPPENAPDMFINTWVAHWSNDSHYVYIGWSLCCWDSGGFVFYSPSNLERFNIETGILDYVISGNMTYSFSPTDRRLIEIQEPTSPIILQIHDQTTGDVTNLSLQIASEYDQAGFITWSPDGLRFVIIAGHGTDVGGFTETMVLVDLRNLSQKILVKDTGDDIDHLDWSENDILHYTTTNYSSNVPVITVWYRDMNTLEFASPTPIP